MPTINNGNPIKILSLCSKTFIKSKKIEDKVNPKIHALTLSLYFLNNNDKILEITRTPIKVPMPKGTKRFKLPIGFENIFKTVA